MVNVHIENYSSSSVKITTSKNDTSIICVHENITSSLDAIVITLNGEKFILTIKGINNDTVISMIRNYGISRNSWTFMCIN